MSFKIGPPGHQNASCHYAFLWLGGRRMFKAHLLQVEVQRLRSGLVSLCKLYVHLSRDWTLPAALLGRYTGTLEPYYITKVLMSDVSSYFSRISSACPLCCVAPHTPVWLLVCEVAERYGKEVVWLLAQQLNGINSCFLVNLTFM